MVRLILLLLLVFVVLFVVALIECLSADGDDVRALPRVVWLLVILLLPIVGSIAWFAAGRPRPAPTRSGTGGLAATWRGPARRPLAPDDDPEFLRQLSATLRKADEERLRRGEDEHRRPDRPQPHQDEPRPREDGADPPAAQ